MLNISLRLLLSFIFIASQNAFATAQVPDKLIYKGERMSLFTTPLEGYYGLHNPRPEFESPNTGNWRGYVATWEISGDVLYLTVIEARIAGKDVGLGELFPRQKGRVQASWFTGNLRIPKGRLVEYVHFGYSSVYERYLIISIEQGKVVKEGEFSHTSIPPWPR